MGKHYYYEADYCCDCEACGKQFRGVIRRGPLEYAGGVIPAGIGAAVETAVPEIQACADVVVSSVEDAIREVLAGKNRIEDWVRK